MPAPKRLLYEPCTICNGGGYIPSPHGQSVSHRDGRSRCLCQALRVIPVGVTVGQLDAIRAKLAAAESANGFLVDGIKSALDSLDHFDEEDWRVRDLRSHLMGTITGEDGKAMQTINDNLQLALAAAEETVERMRSALQQIVSTDRRPFDGIPADWQEQIDACEECQSYKGHPIQNGICNKHRQPIWDREKHTNFEQAALGHRMREIARAALSPADPVTPEETPHDA